jgi:hypothetical protein
MEKTMADEFTKQVAKKTTDDLWFGIGGLCSTGMDAKTAFMKLVPLAIEASYERQGVMTMALATLLAAPDDHMTACDRTMGDSHPCTCGADEARKLLSTPAYN